MPALMTGGLDVQQ